MNWNGDKEEQRLIFYLLGFNDGEIGTLSEPVVGKSNVCSWRGRRGLLPNHGLSDRKWYPLNNPLNRVLGGRPGHPLSEEREEFLRRLYDEGLNDLEIAERAGRAKTTIRRWRLRKRLPPNAPRGGQPVQKSWHKVKGKTRKIRKNPRSKRTGRKWWWAIWTQPMASRYSPTNPQINRPERIPHMFEANSFFPLTSVMTNENIAPPASRMPAAV